MESFRNELFCRKLPVWWLSLSGVEVSQRVLVKMRCSASSVILVSMACTRLISAWRSGLRHSSFLILLMTCIRFKSFPGVQSGCSSAQSSLCLDSMTNTDSAKSVMGPCPTDILRSTMHFNFFLRDSSLGWSIAWQRLHQSNACRAFVLWGGIFCCRQLCCNSCCLVKGFLFGALGWEELP